jgi:hypothetical protein
MYRLLTLALLFCGNICLCQVYPPGDTLTMSTYETSRIYLVNKTYGFDIESKTQFPFCSQIYKIPKDCVSPYEPDCCRYTTNTYDGQKTAIIGTVSCLNGYSLSWTYTQDISEAKAEAEEMSGQIEAQTTNFRKEKINCYVLGQESSMYKLEGETKSGVKLRELLYYGSYKSYNFVISYLSVFKKLESNEDIQPAIRNIIRFKE